MVVQKTNFGERLAEEAQRWVRLNVPFAFRGHTTRGCDCGGFLVGLINGVCQQDHKVPSYTRDWNLHKGNSNVLLDEVYKYGVEKSKENLQIGNILIFEFGRYQSHLGIYIGQYRFIHCHEMAKKCCIDILINSTWEKRLRKVFRLDESKLTKI